MARSELDLVTAGNTKRCQVVVMDRGQARSGVMETLVRTSPPKKAQPATITAITVAMLGLYCRAQLEGDLETVTFKGTEKHRRR